MVNVILDFQMNLIHHHLRIKVFILPTGAPPPVRARDTSHAKSNSIDSSVWRLVVTVASSTTHIAFVV